MQLQYLHYSAIADRTCCIELPLCCTNSRRQSFHSASVSSGSISGFEFWNTFVSIKEYFLHPTVEVSESLDLICAIISQLVCREMTGLNTDIEVLDSNLPLIWSITLCMYGRYTFWRKHAFIDSLRSICLAPSCEGSVKTEQCSSNRVLLSVLFFSPFSRWVVLSTIPGTLAKSVSLPCKLPCIASPQCVIHQTACKYKPQCCT